MGGNRRRVSGFSRQAGDVTGLHVHVVHVFRGCPYVLGSDVSSPETLNEPTVGAKNVLAIPRLVVADDDRLAAAEVETGNGVLVRHAAREAQRVGDRFFVTVIGPEPRPAKRGPQPGAV